MTNQILDASDPLLSRKEAASYLSERGLTTAPQTLARKFHEGVGPAPEFDEYFAKQLSPPRRFSSEMCRSGLDGAAA